MAIKGLSYQKTEATQVQTVTSVDIESPIIRLTSRALAVVDDVCGAQLAVWSSRSRAAVETDAGQTVAQWWVGQTSAVTVTLRTLRVGISGA